MIRDLLAITKPPIVRMTVVMAYAGIALAPVHPSWSITLLALLGVALSVGSANALNMVIERKTDGLMHRTKGRPIPAGRLSARTGLLFGIALGLAAMAILLIATNLLTAALGAAALLMYVLIYTPLKKKTRHALLIGAVPGAIPPLMGWTAATNSIAIEGIALFAILLIWQIPHFLAISMYLAEDYARADIPVVPLVRGTDFAKIQTLAYSSALLPVSLVLFAIDVASWTYLAVAAGTGLWLLFLAAWGLTLPEAKTEAWAKSFFVATLFYLPLLTMAVIVDRVLL